jgi:RNA 2',3'-cyclic 3'-phosphodiesterase
MLNGTVDDSPRVRLFFAAVPDAATREHIAAVADSLQLDSLVRRVRRDNYHVTLRFIGGVPASRVSIAQQIGRAQRADKFSLRFGAYEYWPKPKAVVTVANAIPDALERLRQGLNGELAAFRSGVDPELFRPHVTLARKVSQASVLQAMSPFDWPVREFSLMRSDTRGSESAYTVVDTWSLLDESAET